MSEFNGKKFYGYSLHNDPQLSTTTRNFEFKYARPEALERAIQKVADNSSEKSKSHMSLSRFPKVKHSARDLVTPFESRDLDVDTQMSSNDIGCNKIRTLTDKEINQLIGRAKSSLDDMSAYESNTCSMHGKSIAYANDNDNDNDNDNADLNYKTRDEMMLIQGEDKAFQLYSVEEYRQPQPQWVEIEATPFSEVAIAEEIVQLEGITAKEAALHENAALVEYVSNFDIGGSNMHMQQETQPYEGTDQETFFVEDSDLEYEMLGRADYTKLCGPRPKEEEMLNSKDSGGFAEFIEIPCINLSFLKNSSPMHYSEMTDDNPEDRMEGTLKMQMKAPKQQEESSKAAVKEAKKRKDTKKKVRKVKAASVDKDSPSPRNNLKSSANATPTASARTPRQRNNGSCSNYTATSSRSPVSPKEGYSRTSQHHAHAHMHYHSNVTELRSMKAAIMSKCIEDLKAEKVAIFTKMTAAQERIIELLDKLRIHLLEMYVPENTYEKTKRQRNAFEFSVRFSRNFLYPLKGMIEDLRMTTVEQLNSASSNEACARMSTVFALFCQSLQTYHKQLRYFLLDQVPQKLGSLVEMLLGTINLCLEKSVFDPNDAIIECLRERCQKFLNFLEEMQEERYLTAQESNRRGGYERSPSNYNLKMFMNDLNMYEPKLVPKCNRRRHSRKGIGSGSKTNISEDSRRSRNSKSARAHKLAHRNNSAITNASNMGITKSDGDAIATQVEATDLAASSGIMSTFQITTPSSSPAVDDNCEQLASALQSTTLNKSIIEALQMVTKEQVRHVLEPIIQSLGSVLDKKNTTKTIESILSTFSMNLISMAQGEVIRKQHDDVDDKYGEEYTVLGAKADSNDSISQATLAQNTSKASKATKHTKASRQPRDYETHIEVGNDDDTTSQANASNNNTDEFDIVVNEVSSEKSDTNETVSENGSAEAERFSMKDHDAATSNFSIIMTNKRTKQQLSQQPTTQQQEQQQSDATDSQQQQCTLTKQVNSQQQLQNRTIKDKSRMVPLTMPLPSMPLQSKTSISPLKSTRKPFLLNLPAKPEARFSKCKIFKKKRNPILPPPPAPAGTPTSTARARISEQQEEFIEIGKLVKLIENNESNKQHAAAPDCKIPLTDSFETRCVSELLAKYLKNTAAKDAINSNDLQYAMETNKSTKNSIPLYVHESPYDPVPERTQRQLHKQQLLEDKQRQEQEAVLIKEIQQCEQDDNAVLLDDEEQDEQEQVAMESYRKKDISYLGSVEYLVENSKVSPPSKNTKMDINQLLQERDNFLRACEKNRFYRNPNYAEPWKVISKISADLSNEVVTMLEEDFTIGVSKFVHDFLTSETQS